jgi:pimeloyl-ACP methyl ester carboxylesterase
LASPIAPGETRLDLRLPDPTSGKEIEMKVVNHVYPTFEQIMPLAQDPTPGPIAMLNLPKFRDKAQYQDGRADDISGREAYMRYVAEMGPIVEAAGGRFLFSGDVSLVRPERLGAEGVALFDTAWRVLERWEKPFVTAYGKADPVLGFFDVVFQEHVPGAQGQSHRVFPNATHFIQEQEAPALVEVLNAIAH